jgi:signal transduction histidine kinase
MKRSIRYRLFVPLGLLLLGVVGISAWSAVAAAQQAEERIARQVRGVTHTLAGTSITLTQPILQQMKGLSGADYLLSDADGNLLSTLSGPPPDLPERIRNQPIENAEADRLGEPIDLAGQRYRCRRLPQRVGGNLFILYPEASLNEAIRDAVRPSLVFGLFGGLASMALMYLIGQRLVGRIRELERRTRLIAAGDFSPMPLPAPNDELRDLSQSVNEMAERLAQFQEAVRLTERLRLLGQLSGGLAHQLRNSVTGAKLAIQLHVQECPAPDQEALQVALRQLNLMESNLRRFMDLGKSEGRPSSRASAPGLVDDVVALLRPQAEHAGVALRWQRPPALRDVAGDADQLRDALQNIVGNAVEAAGANGAVEVRCENDAGPPARVVVEISDTGPGPPAALEGKLFDPFVTGKPEGIGLGLAVARHAVERHGGDISWRRGDGRTIFRIVLPAAPD